MRVFSRPILRHLAVYLFYLLVAIVITWPVVTQLASVFVGGSTSDAYEMSRHIWWFKHALQTGQPIFYQTTLGYPDGFSGVSLWAGPLQFFPAWLFAFVMPLSSAYNLHILLALALNGWAMFFLMRYLLDNRRTTPPLIAGLIFMSAPVFQGHLFEGHGGLIVMWPAVLYVYALLRVKEADSRGWILLAALFFFLTPLGHTMQTIYVLLPVTVLFIIGLLWQRDWQALSRVITSAAIGTLALFIFLLPVLSETIQTSAYTDAGGYVRYSADLLGVISPAFKHPFFSRFIDYPHTVLGSNIGEGASYAGIIVGLLALTGLLAKRESRWWMLLGAVAWVLSLGPLLKFMNTPVTIHIDTFESYIPMPWALVQDLPFFNLSRTPGRFNFTLAIALAVMAGYGVNALVPRREGDTYPIFKYVMIALLGIGILWEYQLYTTLFNNTMPVSVPDAVINLRERDDVRAVFNVPWEHLLAAKDALYLQTWHEKPLIAGQVSRQTPVNPAKLSLLQQTLDPAQLHSAGADVVILHKGRIQGQDRLTILMQQAQDQLGAPYYEDAQIALYDVPDAPVEEVHYWLPPTSLDIRNKADGYLYVDQPSWDVFSGTLYAANRDVSLSINGIELHRWTVDGQLDFKVPVPIAIPGYHTLTLALNPPCPTTYSETLVCRTLQMENLTLTQNSTVAVYDPVQFSGGITLSGAEIMPTEDRTMLDIYLWWAFEEARDENDIRFVHVLDSTGQNILQNDKTLGNHEAGSQWVETITLNMQGLENGRYIVYTGWYTYPDIVRYDVLSDVPGAVNKTVEIGTFRIGE